MSYPQGPRPPHSYGSTPQFGTPAPRLRTSAGGTPPRSAPRSPCPIVDLCGGCPSIAAPYQAQLLEKTQTIKTLLAKSPWSQVFVAPCQPSPQRFHYRHTVKLVVEQKLMQGKPFIRIGLYKPGSHQVVDVGHCPVHTEGINHIVGYLRTALKNFSIPVWQQGKPTGLRYIVIRQGAHTGHTQVTWVVNQNLKPQLRALSREMLQRFSHIQGAFQHVNTTSGNSIFDHRDQKLELIAGQDLFREVFCGSELQAQATTFVQVNPPVANRMYERLVELLEPEAQDVALDLYCGMGAISFALARRCRRVTGIEESPSSIADAKNNAFRLGMANTHFVQGRSEEALTQLSGAPGSHLGISLVAMNPSRGGCQRALLEQVAALKPRAMAYMSCDPSSLFRDLHILDSLGYAPVRFEPFDMFPGTPHVETLCLILPKDN